MDEEKLKSIIQRMMDNNEPPEKIREAVRKGKAMMAKPAEVEEVVEEEVELAPELEERAANLFGGEIGVPKIGAVDASLGSGMTSVLKDKLGPTEDFETKQKKIESERVERDDILKGPNAGTWEGYVEWTSSDETIAPPSKIGYEIYLENFPTTFKPTAEKIKEDYYEEDNLFEGLEFDKMATAMGDDYDPKWFAEWRKDAGDGTIARNASERLNKNGPTKAMRDWANDKYGDSSNEAVINAIETDPTSPWKEYFFPLSTHSQKYKSLDFDPNDPDPSKRTPEATIENWEDLTLEEKTKKIQLGEGDLFQQLEINDKYGDNVAILEAKSKNLGHDGKELNLNFESPATIEDYENLYTFFTGQNLNEAVNLTSSKEFNNFTPSYEVQAVTQNPFKDKQSLSSALGDELNDGALESMSWKAGRNTEIRDNLKTWWEEYQKNPLVQSFIVNKNQQGNLEEYDKLVKNGKDAASIDITNEINLLPEMQGGPLSIILDTQKEIEDLKKEAANLEDWEWFSEIRLKEKIAEKEEFIKKTREDFNYGGEAFDEEGYFIQDYEWKGAIPEGAYTGPGSMWEETTEVSGTGGSPEDIAESYGNDTERIGEAIINKRAELQRLINLGAKSTAVMGADRGNIQKLVGGIRDYIDPTTDTWIRDAKTLQEMAKTGKLNSNFRNLRSNHPLALQINQAKQQLVGLNMAYSLNIDPLTSKKELYSSFDSSFGSIVDALTGAVSGENIFDNIEGYGKDELAESFKMALEEDGMTLPQSAHERIDKTIGELTRDITMPLIPLIAEIALFKKVGGKSIGKIIDSVGDLIKYSAPVVKNSPRLQSVVSTIVGGTVKKGTKFQHVMQASAVKEMTYLAGADLIGGSIYGREAMDPLFGFSMGAGMAIVEKNMINSAAKRIPFFTPLMNTIARQTVGRSSLLKGGLQTVKGAAIGTGIMTGAEAVVAYKNYLIDGNKKGLLEEFERMTDMDHVTAMLISMTALGIKGNKFYDNLSKDFATIVKGNTPQYRAARKKLGLDKIKEQEVELQEVDIEGKPIKGTKVQKTQESTIKEIDDAYNNKVQELKSDPKFERDLKPNGEVIPGSKLEGELKEIGDAKAEVERYNDIMLAKSIAKANQKATGSYQQWKNNLWSTSESIKNNRQLNSEQVQFMSELDPKILADMTGMEEAGAVRMIKEASQIMGLADASAAPKTGSGRIKAIEASRDLIQKLVEKQKIELAMKNNPLLKPEYKSILERLDKEIDAAKISLGKEEGSLYAKDLPRRKKTIEKEETFVKGAVETIQEVVGKDAIDFKPVETKEELRTILEEQGRTNINEILEMDAYFDPATNTLYTNKEVMIETEATSAATHELGHWFLRNSFKQKNPVTGQLEITPEGIKIIDKWKGSLPLEQRRLIEKRIQDNYARNKGKFNKKNAYYEEYLTSYIDAVRKEQVKIPRKGLALLMKESSSAKALKELGIDVSTPEGMQMFIESLTKSARKGKLSQELIDFAGKQKPKGEVEVKVEETVEAEVKPEGKEKVEVKEEIKEEVIEEKAEPVSDKRTYKSPKELIKDLEITEADALNEIKEAEEGAIGNRNELIDITTDSKGNRTATIMIGSTTLKDIPVSSVSAPKPVASKTKQVTGKEQAKIISKITGERELKQEKKKLIETQKKLGVAKSNTPEYKSNVKRIKEINQDLKAYEPSSAEGRKAKDKINSTLEKNLEGWEPTVDKTDINPKAKKVFDAIAPTLQGMIRSKLKNFRTKDGSIKNLETVEGFHMHDAVMETLDMFRKRKDIDKFDPKVNDNLYGYINGLLNYRIGDALKTGRVIDNYGSKKFDDLLPFEEKTIITTSESKPESGPAPKSTMRRQESIEFTPKEMKTVNKNIDEFIDTYGDKLKEKDAGGIVEALRSKAKGDIKKILIEKTPKPGRYSEESPYKEHLEKTYDEFAKLASFKIASGGKRLEGDPTVFIKKGGKGYKGFVYGEKGFTKSGAPKRVQVKKGKETIAWDFKEFGKKEGEQITKKDWVDYHYSRGEYKGGARPNEKRTQMIDIKAETILKDALPEGLKRNADKLGPEAKQTLLFEEISNIINRHPDLIASKNIGEAKRKKIFDDILDEVASSDRGFVEELKIFKNDYPVQFEELVNSGKSLGEWLEKNPEYNKYFADTILNKIQEIALAGKGLQSSFKKRMAENIKDYDLPEGITVKDIKNLNVDFITSKKDGEMLVDEVKLEKFVTSMLDFARYLPKELLNNKTLLKEILGFHRSTTYEGLLRPRTGGEVLKGPKLDKEGEPIPNTADKDPMLIVSKQTGELVDFESKWFHAAKEIEKVIGRNVDPAFANLRGEVKFHSAETIATAAGKSLQVEGAKRQAILDKYFNVKDNQTKIDLYNAIQQAKQNWLNNSQTALKSLERLLYEKGFVTQEFSGFDGVLEFPDSINNFTPKRLNEFKKLLKGQDAKVNIKVDADGVKVEFPEFNKKEWLDKAEAIYTLGRYNTNLRMGERQLVPILAAFNPKGKVFKGNLKTGKVEGEVIKLEHLKAMMNQSIEAANAIVSGKWDLVGKEITEGFVGVVTMKKYLDVIDEVGGKVNTTNLARMALDLQRLKDYPVIGDKTKTLYDKLIDTYAKELDITFTQKEALKNISLADAIDLYSANRNKIGKIILENAIENKNELKKVAKHNHEIQPIGSKSKKIEPISVAIEKLVNIDKAFELARKIDKPIKKARVFDFDDTVARTKSNVLYEMPNGKKGKLTAEQFAKKGEMMEAEGAKWDFSEFSKVVDGKKGPLFEVMKKMKEAAGERDLFILTARSPEAAPAIHRFLKEMGIDIPIENIKGLGSSSPYAKSDWIIEKAAEGYNDFYFADDAKSNVKAVRDVLEIIDVKSKVQQAIASKSKDLNGEFNRILEATTGVEYYKEFSKSKAEVLGKGKGRYKFFLPSGAEDFLGLIYPTLGKGKMGENQLKWYETNLIKPYSRATQSIATERINMMGDFKRLKKELKVPKDLKKITKSGFSHEQAVRVDIWNKSGMEVPGLSKRDLKELSDIIKNNPKLQAFSEQVQTILKSEPYSKPGKEWLSGTMTTDLIEVLNNKRQKYLQEWNENIDIIYSEKNLNKLESIYGPKYREALENSLTRMKSGKNRTSTGNKASDALLDYINGAQGTIMFLNMRSAVLQGISAANFINLGFNNPIKAGKAFLNQKQYWKDFMEIMNSDYLVSRRNGLKLNISENEIADAAKSSTNKAKAVINYILEKGYAPTKFMDSFAIASGGATWYRNKIKDLVKKEGLSEAEAQKKAFEEFMEISEKSQQSSDPSKISKQQSSDMGRVFLQFVNTPMQYARIQKRAVQDLANKRGDWKSNIAKVLYYGVMQNLWFNAMQQGLFALGFGDDEINEKEEKKIIDTANGMADSILRGSGFAGMTVSVLKNTVIDLYRRSGRQRPEYGDAWIKLLEFSPAVKSKFGKLKSAAYPFDTKEGRKEIKEKGFSLDNPAYESAAKVISAATNIPLDRVYNKYNNLKAMLREDTEVWKDIALFLGWPEWQLEEGGTVKEDKIRNMKNDTKKDEQIEMLLDLGYSKWEIKKMKKEEDRVEAIIERK
ncbi:hypothetical protein H8D85_00210 [bacterium]|nr:hypothetical protein [bacterium]